MALANSLRDRLFEWLQITDEPVVKVYHGFGHGDQMVVMGHVLKISPLPPRKRRPTLWTNTLNLLRLFFVRPYPFADVTLNWEGRTIRSHTEKDGFFRLEWNPAQSPKPGWHEVEVQLPGRSKGSQQVAITGRGHVYVPHRNQYACVSDIDDTFLISHSSNLRKRMFVLLTEDAHSRDPFDDVVEHYQLLARAGTHHLEPNPFFYVSSSEWNLYDYILTFSKRNDMPEGVYLLNQLKRFREILKTGQNKHLTKFNRIARILHAFPELKFILLGDDTQEDPNIYTSIINHFPSQIICVYLRQVNARNRERTLAYIAKIKEAGVECCYFKHSSEAIEHTKRIGLAV